MVKNKPATPLPWKAWFGLDKGTVHPRGSSPCVKNRLTQILSREDAAYVAHAANAYPKLVEFLRDVANDEHAVAARALLTEIGEA